MGVSKVLKSNGDVVIDLTADTITAADLASGVTAHGADGEQITGTNTNDVDSSDLTAAVGEVLATKTFAARGQVYTYYYKAGSTNYSFMLTQSVPVGGQLVCTDNTTLKSYSSSSSTTPIETSGILYGSVGTNLGTLANNTRSGNLNTNNRRRYGSNDWKESAIRQWLNSDKPAGQWWEPQTPWDRPPAYAETLNGFLYDLDPDFLDVIGKTQVTTKYFDTSTGALNGTYTTEDYFFLMSQSQVSSNYSGEGSKYTPYSDNASRIMYRNGSASLYRLRSPSSSNSNYTGLVFSGGNMDYYNASGSLGVAVACNII